MKEINVTRSSMPPFEEYASMIRPLWDTRWLTNMGTYHQKLENELSDYLGVPYVSLTSSGHMALEMVIQAFDFPAGGEVITTPFTFISTTHAILRNNLCPVFCDVKEDYTIDEKQLEQLITERTVAIIPVHVYGNICNVDRIQEIADKYNIKVIYDAAHAFAEKVDGKSVALYGDASIFSFHATKVFHTIEGGAVCSSSQEIYQKMYNLKNFGIRSQTDVVEVGANAKMNEFQAAMGLCNLRYIDEEILRRKDAVVYYDSLLQGVDGISVLRRQADVESNYAYYPVLLETMKERDAAYQVLNENGIHVRKYFYPLTSDEICFGDRFRCYSLDRARDLSNRVLALPLYSEIERAVQDEIVSLLVSQRESN